jgi:hypothetical protein
LGSNLLNYFAQILYAHKNKLFIKFKNNSKSDYSFNHSIFVKILFNYIDKYNEQLSCQEIGNVYNQVPFDVNKTILVHLRLDDMAHWKDYDGSICSNYYKNRIKNVKIATI